MNYNIRKMEPGDLASVALVHKRSYMEDHFSSRLNLNLLKAYYGFLLKYNSFCLVAIHDGQIAGFIVAGENTRKAIKEFIRNKFLPMMFVLLQNPSFIISRIKNYFRIFYSDNSVVSLAKIRLLSIAVDPNAVSKGIATALMNKLEEEVRQSGENYIGLSVHNQNHKAIRLYERLGWKLEKVDGSASYYIIKL